MTLTDNIMIAWHSTDSAARDFGINWFGKANALATELGNGNTSMGAGVLAALSPMTSWPENIKKARMVFESGTTYGLTANRDKAIRIANGEPALSVLSGRKVRTFYGNIMLDNLDNVTVDRHAFDAAYGIAGYSDRIGISKGRFDSVESAYRDCARVIGISPAQLQAVVWVWWRENVIANNHGKGF